MCFHTLKEVFWPDGENVSVRCRKVLFTRPEDHFWGTCYWKSLWVHKFFEALSENMSKFQQTFFGRVVKTAFYVSRATFLGRLMFEKDNFLFFFGIWGKCFELLAKSFRQDCQNCILPVQKINNVKQSFFEKKSVSFVFLELCEIFSELQ